MILKQKTKKPISFMMAFVLSLGFILTLVVVLSAGNGVIARDMYMAANTQATAIKYVYQEDSVYMVVEPMPKFPGGDRARVKFIKENLKYPEDARKEGIQGKVLTSFIIEKNGEISNIKLISGIGGGCDEAAMNAVSKMPRWKPGMHDGKPVRVQFNMPFSFNLDKGKSKTNTRDSDKKTPPPPYK